MVRESIPTTQLAAWKDVMANISEKHREVIHVIFKLGGMATTHEVATALGKQLYQVSGRITELTRKLVLLDSGETRPSPRTGKMMTLWKLNEQSPEEMGQKFTVGDRVKWGSQGRGSFAIKRGVVVEVIPPDARLEPLMVEKNHNGMFVFGFGMPRTKWSYLVMTDPENKFRTNRKIYWPSKLEVDDEAMDCTAIRPGGEIHQTGDHLPAV